MRGWILVICTIVTLGFTHLQNVAVAGSPAPESVDDVIEQFLHAFGRANVTRLEALVSPQFHGIIDGFDLDKETLLLSLKAAGPENVANFRAQDKTITLGASGRSASAEVVATSYNAGSNWVGGDIFVQREQRATRQLSIDLVMGPSGWQVSRLVISLMPVDPENPPDITPHFAVIPRLPEAEGEVAYLCVGWDNLDGAGHLRISTTWTINGEAESFYSLITQVSPGDYARNIDCERMDLPGGDHGISVEVAYSLDGQVWTVVETRGIELTVREGSERTANEE